MKSINLDTLITEVENEVGAMFNALDTIAYKNHLKVIQAFAEARVTDYHLKGTTGYGYSDVGRDTLDKIFATIFDTEAALVRTQMVSGTHAIAVALYGNLLPGDLLISLNGRPYDTLHKVIGIDGDVSGSLTSLGISYEEVALTAEGKFDFVKIKDALQAKPKMAMLQRSRGYAWRSSFSVAEIGQVCSFIKEQSPETIIFVDNCYGELVEEQEPTQVGADLMAGSLIKNLGGGLAPTGGYVVGEAEYVARAAARLTAPGIGSAVGCTLDNNRLLYQGLYLAPHTVNQALKGAVFCAALYRKLGFVVSPNPEEPRSDLIQAIRFDNPELMKKFCQGLQKASPIDPHVTPEPWAMPGYEDPVIMAGGTFVQGSTMELSADGPMRSPYVAYLQGGLSYDYVKLAAIFAYQEMSKI